MKLSLTTWPTPEEREKCGQGTKGQERDRRSAGRCGVEWMACCEQEPPAFPLLKIMGQEGKLKEQFESPNNS